MDSMGQCHPSVLKDITVTSELLNFMSAEVYNDLIFIVFVTMNGFDLQGTHWFLFSHFFNRSSVSQLCHLEAITTVYHLLLCELAKLTT